MPRTDYEAAWHELAELILSRDSGWGSKSLAAEMTRLAAKHQVSETFLERALRLYGGELVLSASNAEAPSNGAVVGMPARAAADPAHRQSEGGHDGSHHDIARLARA